MDNLDPAKRIETPGFRPPTGADFVDLIPEKDREFVPDFKGGEMADQVKAKIIQFPKKAAEAAAIDAEKHDEAGFKLEKEIPREKLTERLNAMISGGAVNPHEASELLGRLQDPASSHTEDELDKAA